MEAGLEEEQVLELQAEEQGVGLLGQEEEQQLGVVVGEEEVHDHQP